MPLQTFDNPSREPDARKVLRGAMVRRCLFLLGLTVLPVACTHSSNLSPVAIQSTSADRPTVVAVAPAAPPAAVSWESFHQSVQPILAQYCMHCHGAEKPEKGLRLDLFTDEGSLHIRFDVLVKALAMLYGAKMPPPCEYQLSPQELTVLTGWIAARQKFELAAHTGK